MSNEIHFVQEIEKRECLYNYNLPEYNRKDLTEQAWAEVARNRHLTVTECKEKWRNIRSSLLRSMKKGEKTKKPYYLTPYLQFIVPFTKLADEVQKDSQMSEETNTDVKMNTVKSEADQDEVNNEAEFEAVDVVLSETDMLNEKVTTHRSTQSRRNTAVRKRKRPLFSRKQGETRSTLRRKHSEHLTIHENRSSRLSNSSMRYFLLSLLPDFEFMTNDQIRTFKIKVMMLIDDIKSNFSEVRESLSCSQETERLQKRLINLLVKNLKKNS